MKFRFVDRILAWTPNHSIRGVKSVSFEEYSLKERFADEPRLPESLLLESFLQLGNWLILLSTRFEHCGIVVRISEVHFDDALRPGDTVELSVRVVRQREEGWEFEGSGCVGNRLVISGKGCVAATIPAADLMNTEDLRTLYSEIHASDAESSA